MYDEQNIIQQKLTRRIGLDSLSQCEFFPKYIQIEPTDRCNARCSMCTKSMTKNPHFSTMNMRLFKKILDELKNYSSWIEMVTIQWMGEPLMDIELEEKISQLKEIGIKKVSLTTNVSLLDEDRTRSLLKSGLDDLRMSIDSINEKTYEKIRRGLIFDEVIKNACSAFKIRNEVKPDATIRVRMVEMGETKDEVKEWLNYWEPLMKEKDWAQVMPELSKWSVNGSEYINEDPCVSVFSTIVISAKGTVALCCVDSELECILGNVNIESIKGIWNSDNFRKIRAIHLNGKRNELSLCLGCNCWNRY